MGVISPNPPIYEKKHLQNRGRSSLMTPSRQVKAATPGLLNALGDTFVGASAELTPEQRREGGAKKNPMAFPKKGRLYGC